MASDDRGKPTAATRQAPDRWDRADFETVRLSPNVFPDISPDVVVDLNGRGCTIPQVWYHVEPANVVHGRFTDPGRMDLAVLCSVERVSSILVYRGSSTGDVAVLNPVPDRNYLQDVGGHIGFSRAIHAVDPEFIRYHHAALGGPEPPPLDHDGVNDAFVGKASRVWYWHDGKWLRLQGAD
ncbi:MAG: hypothetical protein J4G09_14385 [Proteobacteria bacterium]|nr:hypothetical protein [Pseudomonadota bacterium]